MYKYIYNTKGEYVAFVLDDKYCFSNENEHIGFFDSIHLYDYDGNYIGDITSDDRIVRHKNINMPSRIPINKPLKPFPPFPPFNRYSMSKLPYNYEDVFINKILNKKLDELDEKFKKYIDMKIYANDGTFLGNINFNRYDQDSLANRYGEYGSEYSQKSVFNKYGNYGSPYNSLSPFNPYTQTPPIIKDRKNKTIGKLTANKYLPKEIDSINFFKWFNSKIEK